MRRFVSLQPIDTGDNDFLYEVFCSAREDLAMSLDMPDEKIDQLMRLQYAAQQSAYVDRYPEADFDLVLVEGRRAGYVYAQRGPDSYVLIDIALLPDERNSGVGSHVVCKLIAEARAAEKPLSAHVLKSNAAWRLWERLGFQIVGDDGVYFEIEVPFGDVTRDR